MNSSLSLTLSAEERAFLFDILEERQRMLLREIDHADHHDFKIALKRKERMLESLLDRVTTHV